MIILGSAILGAIIGAMTARKRGGAGLDLAQYGASFAIAFGLIGLIATIAIHRLAV